MNKIDDKSIIEFTEYKTAGVYGNCHSPEKFSEQWHIEHGLKECDDIPQEYSLSGILHTLRHPPRDGSDTSLDMGHWAPARYIPFRRHFLRRLKYAWMVLKGEVSILHYR